MRNLRDMQIPRNIEKIYVVLSMLFLGSGLIPRTADEGDTVAQILQGPADKYGQLVVYALLVPLLLFNWKRIAHGLRHSGWIVALCGLVLASALWSFNWRFTAQRGLLLTAMTLFGIYIATCFDWDEQLNLFGWLSVVAVFGSAFMAVFVPTYGLSHDLHQGAVKGLFSHKNMLGRQMAFAVLTMWLARPKSIPGWLRVATVAGGLLLLALSNAITALLSFLLCVAIYPVIYLVRLRRRNTLPLWIPLVPLFAMVLFGVYANYGTILQAAGRSATLTGRTAIWHATESAIANRLWLGYGHDVFWNRWNMDLAKVNYMLGFRPPHAHNGYLDILLSIGVIGLLVFLAGFVAAFLRAVRLFKADDINGARWPLLILIFIAAFNMGESSMFRQFSFLWIPYVSIYVSLAMMMAEARVRAFVETPVPGSTSYSRDEERGNPGILPDYSV